MSLPRGTRIGPYEVRDLIGAGAMGEVYRAWDTKLDRDVALKILPDGFATDAEHLARFEREAKVLASVNHPNIAIVYGLEDSGSPKALIMELVEGPTLADRILKGPIQLDEALKIAQQVASGLHAVHAIGITHRDLKPGNIKITAAGGVKVLDFGLAKTPAAVPGTQDPTNATTVPFPPTVPGQILGTYAYMSPEQARGAPVDEQTDIWAFGCVLYEMLTGRKVFGGATPSDTIAAVLNKEPDLAALPATTPPAIHALVKMCLEKEPARRLHDIRDAKTYIDDDLLTQPTQKKRRAARKTDGGQSKRPGRQPVVTSLPPTGLQGWVRQHPILLFLMVLSAVIAVAVPYWWNTDKTQDDDLSGTTRPVALLVADPDPMLISTVDGRPPFTIITCELKLINRGQCSASTELTLRSLGEFTLVLTAEQRQFFRMLETQTPQESKFGLFRQLLSVTMPIGAEQKVSVTAKGQPVEYGSGDRCPVGFELTRATCR